MATLLLFVALMAGCSAPPQAPVSEAAAPVAAVYAPKAADLRVEPLLQVQVIKATRLYTGPGTYYLVIGDLAASSAVTYLSNQQGWLQVRTADGERGWLTAVDAALTDGRGQPVTYTVANGKWQIKAANGLTLALERAGTGVMRLTVTGLTEPPKVVAADGASVALLGPVPGPLTVAGDIGDSGVGRVSISEKGILVDLERGSLFQVTENAGGRVVLEVRPGLTALESLGDKGWRLTVTGVLQPALRQDGRELVLDLPGALLAPGFAGAPAGANLETVAPAGGLRLRVPAPAGPYAVYRPAPGHLELRYLTPGIAGKTIVLDPGHGGEETGAVGPGGHIEKDIDLAVALQLKPLLEQAGARVIMTRTADARVLPAERAGDASSSVERTQMDLAARSAIANAAGADLYLSIHSNGGAPGEGGTESYWASNNLNAPLSRHLAELTQAELLSAFHLTDRGAKQRPFNVIRMSDAPAALVEMAFLTDWAEERLLASPEGQAAAAAALARAIQRYFAL
jgi:N-acetylmuramoyl-L-alanine amidase